jgi:hypothetical protein
LKEARGRQRFVASEQEHVPAAFPIYRKRASLIRAPSKVAQGTQGQWRCRNPTENFSITAFDAALAL